MANSWISHVRAFAEKKKMKYTDAMKSAECKAEYQNNKPKSSEDMKMEMNKVIIKQPRKTKAKMDAIALPPMEMKPDVLEVKSKQKPVKNVRIKVEK